MDFLIYIGIGAVVYLLPFLTYEYRSKDPAFGIFVSDTDDAEIILATVFALLVSWLVWPLAILVGAIMVLIKELTKLKRRKDEK